MVSAVSSMLFAVRFRSKREHLKKFLGLLPGSQGQNLAYPESGVCVPRSLYSGPASTLGLTRARSFVLITTNDPNLKILIRID